MPQKLGAQFSSKPRERRYDFEAMGVTDGDVYLLEKGSDYQCSETAIRKHMRDYAKDFGLVFASKVRRERGRIKGVEVVFARSVQQLPNLDGSGAVVGGAGGPEQSAGESGLSDVDDAERRVA